jgi:hypothetical protein
MIVMIKMNELSFLSALLLGLMSSGHCLGMCGGISAAFGIANPQQTFVQRAWRLIAYNAGRIFCYAMLGLLLGYVGQIFVQQFQSLLLPLRVMAGLMLIAMACYLSQWWMGILIFERLGQRLWKIIQPLSLLLTPIDRLRNAFLFGLLWGLLPCGLVYSMLVWVSSSGNMWSASLMMIAFGLGTLPSMFASCYSAAQLRKVLQHKQVRMASSVLLLLFGVWTIVMAVQHSAGHDQHKHQHRPL